MSVADDACTINGKQVKFKDVGSGKYTLKIVVEENDNDRSPGTVPISCEIRQAATSKTVSRIFKFTEENNLAIDAHRPNLGKASIVRILPKSPVGIGGRLILKIVGSTTDEVFVWVIAERSIPMPWDESDSKRRAAVIFMSQVLSKNAASSKLASKVEDSVKFVVDASGSSDNAAKEPFDERQNMINDLPVNVFLERKILPPLPKKMIMKRRKVHDENKPEKTITRIITRTKSSQRTICRFWRILEDVK